MTRALDALDDLIGKLDELDGTHHLTWKELFPDEFIRAHSKCNAMDELLEKSGFKIESMEDFKAIPDNEWERYIQANTSFESWEAMQSAAVSAWTRRNLGLT